MDVSEERLGALKGTLALPGAVRQLSAFSFQLSWLTADR
jgi:hypothetical protein